MGVGELDKVELILLAARGVGAAGEAGGEDHAAESRELEKVTSIDRVAHGCLRWLLVGSYLGARAFLYNRRRPRNMPITARILWE
jgi:hypothetical protein